MWSFIFLNKLFITTIFYYRIIGFLAITFNNHSKVLKLFLPIFSLFLLPCFLHKEIKEKKKKKKNIGKTNKNHIQPSLLLNPKFFNPHLFIFKTTKCSNSNKKYNEKNR